MGARRAAMLQSSWRCFTRRGSGVVRSLAQVPALLFRARRHQQLLRSTTAPPVPIAQRLRVMRETASLACVLHAFQVLCCAQSRAVATHAACVLAVPDATGPSPAHAQQQRTRGAGAAAHSGSAFLVSAAAAAALSPTISLADDTQHATELFDDRFFGDDDDAAADLATDMGRAAAPLSTPQQRRAHINAYQSSRAPDTNSAYRAAQKAFAVGIAASRSFTHVARDGDDALQPRCNHAAVH